MISPLSSDNRTLRLFAACFGFAALLCFCPDAAAQIGQWGWMGGSDLNNICQTCVLDAVGVYGTLGVPAGTNIPGGRMSAATWTDKSGNLWLFGGNGLDSVGNAGNLNDFWEFNPATKEWTWMGGNSRLPFPDGNPGWPGVYGTQGVPAKGNYPGAREQAVTWVDQKGNLWLFGGEGYGTIGNFTGNLFFNDLWEFNPSANEWTWVSGSNTAGTTTSGQPGVYGTLGTPAAGNAPGSRMSAVGWTDNAGNLWLFGGSGQGDLNDLWEFNPTTGLWAWMGGSNTIQPGVYGTIGVPATTNIPGGRQGAAGWKDAAGNFWLFGGQGHDSSNNNSDGFLNDLWEFNPSTLEWTWMGGNNTLPCNDVCGWGGIYGTLNVSSSENQPGGRSKGAYWNDNKGNLWLFGGEGFNSSGPEAHLGDLWKYTVSTNEWTWMGGWSTFDRNISNWPGIYGSLQVPAIANTPGPREMSQSWTDFSGNLWLFGGYASDAVGIVGQLNDVWEYQPGNANPQKASAPNFQPGAGTYSAPQIVSISGTTSIAALYFTEDGSTPTTNSFFYGGNGVHVDASETIRAIAVVPNYLNSDVSSATYTVSIPAPTFALTASAAAITIKSGQSGTVTLTVSPQSGFNSSVNFACSGLPSGALCTFSPSTVTPTGSAVSTNLTINTSGVLAANGKEGIWVPSSLIMLSLCFVVWKKKNRAFRSFLVPISVFAIVSLLSGCGGANGGASGSKRDRFKRYSDGHGRIDSADHEYIPHGELASPSGTTLQVEPRVEKAASRVNDWQSGS